MQQQHLPDWTDSEENTPCSLRGCEIDNPDPGEGDLIRKWFAKFIGDISICLRQTPGIWATDVALTMLRPN
jgi:hypothetical protein